MPRRVIESCSEDEAYSSPTRRRRDNERDNAPPSTQRNSTPKRRSAELDAEDNTGASARRRLLQEGSDDEVICTGSVTAEQRNTVAFETQAILVEDSDDEREGACPVCDEPWDAYELVGCDTCEHWAHVQCTPFRTGREAQHAKYYCPQCVQLQAWDEVRIDSAPLRELKELIVHAGLRHGDCLEKQELRDRAREALGVLRGRTVGASSSGVSAQPSGTTAYRGLAARKAAQTLSAEHSADDDGNTEEESDGVTSDQIVKLRPRRRNQKRAAVVRDDDDDDDDDDDGDAIDAGDDDDAEEEEDSEGSDTSDESSSGESCSGSDDDEEDDEEDDEDDEDGGDEDGDGGDHRGRARPDRRRHHSRSAGPPAGTHLQCTSCGESKHKDSFSAQQRRGLYGEFGSLRCLHCTTSQPRGRNGHVRNLERQAEEQRNEGGEAERETDAQRRARERREAKRTTARPRRRQHQPSTADRSPPPFVDPNVSDGSDDSGHEEEGEEEGEGSGRNLRGREREASVVEELERRFGRRQQAGQGEEDDGEEDDGEEDDGEEDDGEENEEDSEDEEESEEEGEEGEGERAAPSHSRSDAGTSSSRGERDRNACYFCGRIGHWANACPLRTREQREKEKVYPRNCHRCGLRCEVKTSRTDKNPGRHYYRCEPCQQQHGQGWVGWCDGRR